MRKFIAFVKATWQLTLAYRGESLVWFILELIPLLIMISFWNSLVVTHRLAFTQFSQLTLYYLLTLIISRLTSVHFEDWIIEEIKDGKISTYLLKPFSYQIYLLASEATWRISGLVYLVPALIVLVPVLSRINFPSPGITQILFFILVLLLTFFQRYFLGFIIGIAAFWFEQSKSLVHLKWMCEGIFGGAWLPLYFFPLWLQNFARFTPFYSWYFFPVELILKPAVHPDLILNVIITLSWTLGLLWVAKTVWAKALSKYSAVGN
jgi:ABC-2 type transport system permease protein